MRSWGQVDRGYQPPVGADDPGSAGKPDRPTARQVCRRVADEYFYVSWFHDPLEIAVGICHAVGMYAKTDVHGLARLERDPCESGELLDRPGDPRDEVVQVKLHDLSSGATAGVADPDRHCELAIGGHLGGTEAQVVDLERGVGPAEAEGEKRGRIHAADAGALSAA